MAFVLHGEASDSTFPSVLDSLHQKLEGRWIKGTTSSPSQEQLGCLREKEVVHLLNRMSAWESWGRGWEEAVQGLFSSSHPAFILSFYCLSGTLLSLVCVAWMEACVLCAEENVLEKCSVFFPFPFHWAKLMEGSQVEDKEPFTKAGAKTRTRPGAATGRDCR